VIKELQRAARLLVPIKPSCYLKQPTTSIEIILSDSPYQPQSNDETPMIGAVNRLDSPELLPFALLGLRLLGIMFVVEGVGAIFGGSVQWIFQARAYSDAGYEVPIDPHSVGWLAGGIPHLIAGLYLIASGNWVLINVFTSTQRRNDERRDATDDIDATDQK
jgi:hypothetical protein